MPNQFRDGQVEDMKKQANMMTTQIMIGISDPPILVGVFHSGADHLRKATLD
jgi:hypothetical protein